MIRTIVLAIVVLGIGGSVAATPAGEDAPNASRFDTTKRSSKLSTGLRSVVDAYRTYESATVAGSERSTFRAPNRELRVIGETLVVDAVAVADSAALARDLESLGARDVARFGAVVSARIPLAMLDRLESLTTLKVARPSYMTSRTGSVTSQGDAALRADTARMDFGVDGSGIRVGVLADGYDCQGGAAADIASGDLPDDVIIVKEEAGCVLGTDEGRAMMQIVHDVAPGAELLFRTASGGRADMAVGIIELAEDFDADVIVDDYGYLNAPFFQDDVVAQAANAAVAIGAAYFSAAGNDGDESYEAAFVASGTVGPGGRVVHDFDSGPDEDPLQAIRVPVGGSIVLTFQWDQPFFSISGAPGTQNDLDIYLIDANGDVIAASNEVNPTTGDAIEVIIFENDGDIDVDGAPGPDDVFSLVVELYAGDAPGLMKYILFRSGEILEHDTGSATCFGHPNAAMAEAVGAADYRKTPEFGVSPAEIELSSSKGGTPILFDLDGQRIDEVREKPEIVAPDGGNNTFFGTRDVEPDGLPNFFGTSAAAPHAAAVAALMLDANPSLTPAQIYSRLEASTSDMDAAGFDFTSGYGLIQADAAVAAAAPRCAAPVSGAETATSTDCLFILRVAVGVASCEPACICAPSGALPTRATDALLCLRTAVGLGGELNCPC
jgi:subtilisin family serine protease